MKIGILTFHDGPNHGAFLQAWSTFRLLCEAGYDVEIVNYKNVKHLRKESGSICRKLKNPLYAWQMWQKQRAFRRAHEQFRLGPFFTDVNAVRDFHYDAIVIGSDVVWNYKLFGYDPVFFGNLNADRLIAFSPSFGTVSPSDKHPSELVNDLAAFHAIAVRDSNSQEIVQRLTGSLPKLTLDPTLVYDFSQEVGDYCSGNTAPDLLVYSYRQGSAVIARAREYASQHNLEVNCVGYPLPLRAPRYCKSVDMACGPFEWVRRFASAHTILTSTFHGVVFSLKSQKPFLYVSGDATYNRVSSLLDFCGIQHELKLGEENRVFLFEPDYKKVTQVLELAAKDSRQWLLDQLFL